MKIIIIGAGIGGLSTYLCLRKHFSGAEDQVTIKVYEAYDVRKLNPNIKPLSEAGDNEPVFTPVAIGSALGIAQNGLKVLQRLDKDGTLLQRAVNRGNPAPEWAMKNARGWTLAQVQMTSESVKKKTPADRSPAEGIGMLMIARQALWEVLRDRVLEYGDVIETKRISSVEIGDSVNNTSVTFEDGTSEEADLIIGADGLRSILRRAMFEKDNRVSGSPQSWLSSWWARKPTSVDYITPCYESLGGFGGWIPTKELQKDSEFDPTQMNIVFGRNGFFGYGCTSATPSNTSTTNDPGPVSAWWSTFHSPTPYPYRAETTPTNNAKPTHTFNNAKALQDLLHRHKNWSNPSIQRILTLASSSGLSPAQYYPTWTTPQLPHWSKNGTVVLIGDAAHTLQPSSGQGASQALEDAEALALLLHHYYHHLPTPAPSHPATTKALAKFEALRRPRVKAIYDRSQKMGKMKGDMGVVMEMMLYAIIWLMSMMHDKQMDAVLDYDLPAEVERIVARD